MAGGLTDLRAVCAETTGDNWRSFSIVQNIHEPSTGELLEPQHQAHTLASDAKAVDRDIWTACALGHHMAIRKGT